MEHSVQRVYGAKARMALMVPSTNTVAETEFWEMAPDGITIHTSRMPFFAERFEKPFDEMESHLPPRNRRSKFCRTRCYRLCLHS